MKKAIITIALLILGIGVSAGFLISASAEEGLIPSWIKMTAGFWVDDQISDQEFISALQYLVQQGILIIPQVQQETQTVQETTSEESFDSNKLRQTNADWTFIGSYASKDGIEVYVSFTEGDPINENYVAVDGYSKLRIVNDNEETVYTGTFFMKQEDFVWYTYNLTGEEKLEFAHVIPFEEIEKSEYGGGRIYLTVEANDNTFEGAYSDIFGLPTFGSEDFDSEYLKSSTVVNQKISKGDFEVTVNNVGFFKQSEFLGEVEEYFRVDMTIKNISNEKKRASLVDLVILDDKNNQYNDVLGGTLDTYSDLYGGVTIEGYELFDKIPEDVKRIRILFDLGRDSNYNSYSYEFVIDLG